MNTNPVLEHLGEFAVFYLFPQQLKMSQSHMALEVRAEGMADQRPLWGPKIFSQQRILARILAEREKK